MVSNFVSKKKQLFDRWAPSYDWLFPSVIYQACHLRLLDYVDLADNSQVLDLGCGTGKLLNRLAASFPFLQGTGVDLSPQMIRLARERNVHHPRLIFIERNAEDLPFVEGQFDAVFNCFSFLHYPNPEQVLGEVSRVLKSGGKYYLVDLISRRESLWQERLLSAGSMRFYCEEMREELLQKAGLSCAGHFYLLGSVLLSVFEK